MAGPAYYTAALQIAQNEDWIVPFVYGSANPDGSNFVPIDLTGSTLMMEIRVEESDSEAIVSVSSADGTIEITNATQGQFTIIVDRAHSWRLPPGSTSYVVDLIRLMPNGYQERLFEGTATCVEGTTRGVPEVDLALAAKKRPPQRLIMPPRHPMPIPAPKLRR